MVIYDSETMILIVRSLFGLLCAAALLDAATVEYDFNITWVSASPDGFTRPVIGINNVWPNPTIRATFHDTIVVNVHNQLGNQSTSIHFHGLFMNGTNYMDGTSGIVQCAIPPDGRFRYKFKAEQVGTYWYHSHMQSQYPDGLRGAFIIDDPQLPPSLTHDEEVVLTLSDWYHGQMPDLLPVYEDPEKHMLPDPEPDSYLINDTQNPKIFVEPGKSYLVRLINIGALRSQKFWISDHEMTIVEVDGVYTKPISTKIVSLAPGQRCAVLLNTKSEMDQNYGIAASVDRSADRMMKSTAAVMSKSGPPNVSGWLVYNSTAEFAPLVTTAMDSSVNDGALQPIDEVELFENVNMTLNLVIDMKCLEDGIEHWMFNTTSYFAPKVPTLFSAMTDENYDSMNRPFLLPSNSIIEIIIYNKHMTGHPVHLHGHTFQIAQRSDKSAGRYNDSIPLSPFPIRRDTVMVSGGGHAVLRYRTDNPGKSHAIVSIFFFTMNKIHFIRA